VGELQNNTMEVSAAAASPAREGACLTVSFQAKKPLALPVRHLLPEKGQVVVGRAANSSDEGERNIRIDDDFVSTVHFSLEKSYNRWVLQNHSRKNGTFVDGAEVDANGCSLRDGALIEIGRSYLVFRAAGPVAQTPLAQEHFTLNDSYASGLNALARMMTTPHPIVLRGESGTGKEVLANSIHRLSKRPGAFQPVNCAALPAGIIESELFGYKKGAFANAYEDRLGLIRAADRGTLFLDEIGDLPLEVQGRFLRVLAEGEVTPLGATRAVKVDFRLLAATHRDLEEMAEAGTFRPDLLARIGGFTLQVPPLRERLEDLGALVSALVRRHAPEKAHQITFSRDAARALVHYPWPLNVRELERALSVAINLSGHGRIDLPHLPRTLLESPADRSETPTRVLPKDHETRKSELIAAMREHKGNVAAVARVYGCARTQIHRWLSRYQIDPADYR
jgi:DNA-binding NtrC family response regulator